MIEKGFREELNKTAVVPDSDQQAKTDHTWTQIKARLVNTSVETIFYISPEGKRFQSLEAAKGWLMANIEEYTDSGRVESSK